MQKPVAGPLPLEARNVAKKFQQGERTIQALDGVDLTLAPGEFLTIMGASGSGKSTLLHALAGLTTIDGGTILVDGQDLSSLSDARLTRFRGERIGLVFQAFNLIPMLSAEDNVRLPAMGAKGLDEKVDALLTRLDMLERRRHKPDALSGGEQQRVAIARALVSDPAILLLDEPTGSLDSETGQDICGLLRTLCNEQGRSIIMVTHEASVAAWADRAVVLKDGRVLDTFQCEGQQESRALSDRYQDALRADLEAAE